MYFICIDRSGKNYLTSQISTSTVSWLDEQKQHIDFLSKKLPELHREFDNAERKKLRDQLQQTYSVDCSNGRNGTQVCKWNTPGDVEWDVKTIVEGTGNLMNLNCRYCSEFVKTLEIFEDLDTEISRVRN